MALVQARTAGSALRGRGFEGALGEMRLTMAPAALITKGGVGVGSPVPTAGGVGEATVGWVSAKIAGGCNFTK